MKPLIQLVKGNVKLVRVKDDALWYTTECGFEFPVPFEETKEATFLPEDSARYFMRWIRKERDRVIKREEEVEAARVLFEAELASAARKAFLERKVSG